MHLLEEVAVGEHPRRLDRVAELHLPPGAAHLGGAQGGSEARRLGPNLLAHLRERLDGGAQGAVVLPARALELLDLLGDVAERLAQRLDELLHRLLLLPEPARGELEEGLRVLAQRVGRERVEAVGELAFGLLEERDLLGGSGALVLELDAQRGGLAARAGARDEPRRGGADRESEDEGEHDHRARER